MSRFDASRSLAEEDDDSGDHRVLTTPVAKRIAAMSGLDMVGGSEYSQDRSTFRQEARVAPQDVAYRITRARREIRAANKAHCAPLVFLGARDHANSRWKHGSWSTQILVEEFNYGG